MTSKKIAIITDIHGNLFLLNKVLKELEKENIDDYIFCGDNITDGFDNEKILNKIKSLTSNVILGNREKSILEYDNKSWQNKKQWKSMLYTYNSLSKENLDYLKTLNIYKIITINNVKICISHGSPYNIRDLVCFNSYEIFDKLIADFNCDIYLFGHTHKEYMTKYKDKLFINTGTLSLPTNNKAVSTYGILTIDEKDIKYTLKEYKYDFKKIKEYYCNSDYHKICNEWCNLILYTLKYGIDYSNIFIEFLNKYCNNDEEKKNELWEEKFKEFMQKNNLEIL